jgi:hypothetical protein
LGRSAYYSRQPYETLAATLRDEGRVEDEADIRFFGRDIERDRASSFWWIWLTVLRSVIGYGYGYRVFRCPCWIAIFTAIGAIPLAIGGPTTYAPAMRVLSAVFYSFVLLVPIPSLETLIHVPPYAAWVYVYLFVHRIIGFLLGGFLVAAIAGLTG